MLFNSVMLSHVHQENGGRRAILYMRQSDYIIFGKMRKMIEMEHYGNWGKFGGKIGKETGRYGLKRG